MNPPCNVSDPNRFTWWTLERKTHAEILAILRSESEKRPWCRYFLSDPPQYPANLNSRCRIGYVPFENCIQDRFYYIDTSRTPEMVAAGGIVTQIHWDSDLLHLPEGWQGVVRQSYYDSRRKKEPNTLVALLAFTPKRYRGQGLSGLMLSKMCAHAQSKGYRSFLVPALPPSQFEKDKVHYSMKEISELRRDDGNYYDYWIRLHSRKKAEVVGYCDTSHRFIFTVRDFSEYVSSMPITSTGEHTVCMDNDTMLGTNSRNIWQKVYADIERDFVTFNWGCVWMRYTIG